MLACFDFVVTCIVVFTIVTCSNSKLKSNNDFTQQLDKHNLTSHQHNLNTKQTELIKMESVENEVEINNKSTTNETKSLKNVLQNSIPRTKLFGTLDRQVTGKPNVTVPVSSNTSSGSTLDPPGTIMVVEWMWHDVGMLFAFTSFVVAATLFRSAFLRSHFLVSSVPEACMMIVLGAFVGGIFFAVGLEAPGDLAKGPTVLNPAAAHLEATPEVTLPVLSPTLFFKVLIPPVLLEAAYTMYDRAVMINIFPILLHAVVGTFLNAIGIGAALYYVAKYGLMGSIERYGEPVTRNYTLDVQDALVYSSIVSGIDAIPVVPIFQESNVSDELFFVLLGESLVNNAVTITMSQYTSKLASTVTFEQEQYGKAVLFLVAVVFGGLGFGVIGGLVSALVTRATHHSPAVEPIALLGIAYLSYISAELIHFSGYISIMGCGLVQAHYAFKNISPTSYNTVKDLTKIISSTSEAVIFLFLGMVLVSKNHSWHTGFVGWTIGLCLASRLIVVVLLSLVHALCGGRYMSLRDQVILSYCGLRGATCFCLAHMVNPLTVAPRQMFITSLLALIVITTFLQGGTVKYLIGILHLSHWKNEKSVEQEFHDQVLSMIKSGVEDITKSQYSIFNPLYKLLRKFDQKILMKMFVRQYDGTNMSGVFDEYAHSYNLALLQHQLQLAIQDATNDKKYKKKLADMPKVFSNFIEKNGPQVFPMAQSKDKKEERKESLITHVIEPLPKISEENAEIFKPNEVIEPSNHEVNFSGNKVHFLASIEKPAQIINPQTPPVVSTAHHEERLEVLSDVESGSPPGPLPPFPPNPREQQPSLLTPNFLRASRQDSIIRHALDRHIQATEAQGSQGRLRYQSPIIPESPSDLRNTPTPPRYRPNLQVPPNLQNRRVSFNYKPSADRYGGPTAGVFRNAVLNSSYRRIRSNGRNHRLEADYPNDTQGELSHHLQSVGDELQHVADVVVRCHSALDQLRIRNLRRRNETSNRRSSHSPRHTSSGFSSRSSQGDTRQGWHDTPARVYVNNPRVVRHSGRHHDQHYHTPSPPRHSRNSPPRHSRNSPPRYSRYSPPRHSRYSPPRHSHNSRSPSASTMNDSWQGRPRYYSRSHDSHRRDVTPPPHYRDRGRAERQRDPPANPPRTNYRYGPAFLAQVVQPQVPNFMLNQQMARDAWGQNPNGALLVPLSQFPQPPRALRVPSMPPYDDRQSWDNPSLQARPARRRPQPARPAYNDFY